MGPGNWAYAQFLVAGGPGWPMWPSTRPPRFIATPVACPEAKRDFGIYRSEVEINKAASDKARHVPNTTACELGNVKSRTSAKAVVAGANA